MAKAKPRNTSASIRQRLLNHSTHIKTDPNLVLIWYGLERFLYRLSVSTYSERFVLKGAMLFRLWGGANFRSTKDLDLEAFLKDEAAAVREVFASICAQPVEDDGLIFEASSVSVAEIREAQEYGGFRVLLTARLGTAILRLQIDVGFGDAITPTPAITEFPSILNQSRPRIRVYPRETVVAEKFEAMVQLGMTNSRMKDYYDIWFMYAADLNHVRQWAAFTKSLGGEATPGLGVVIDKISEFVLPPAIAAATKLPFNHHWEAQSRWQPVR